MLSFFTRHPKLNPKNVIIPFDTKISKYIIDTTNKIKENKSTVENIKLSDNQVSHKCDCDCSLLPFFSMISFLAGYFLSKYNMS